MSSVLVLPSPITVSAPTGTSSLPIVELDRKLVTADRKQIRLRKGSTKRANADCSFGKYQEHLQLNAWTFFHAAKKTELTSTFTAEMVDRKALCFADSLSNVLLWDTANLRRIDRSAFSLEDFSESWLAGRFGEAIASLTMLKKGYVYWDRIAVLWERAAEHTEMTHAEKVRHAEVISSQVLNGRPDLEPDFVFEKPNNEVALMEAKGSFVHPTRDDPSTKNDLRHALDQLDAWSGMITPTPAKSFAIGTYFRDQSDTSGDPSLIAYVDPPGNKNADITPVEFPKDWVRRGNYGAWLVAMGLNASGNFLRSGKASTKIEEQLIVVNLAGQEYVVTIESIALKKRRYMYIYDPYFLFDFDHILVDWPSEPRRRLLSDFGIASFRVIGLEVSTMKLIQKSLADPSSQSLMQRETDTKASLESVTTKGFAGSIFPDGTLYGDLSVENLPKLRLETFQL